MLVRVAFFRYLLHYFFNKYVLFISYIMVAFTFKTNEYSMSQNNRISQKRLGRRHCRGNRQEPISKMSFFKVYLKCFPIEQFLSRIIYRFSYAVQIRCWKLHFEIRKTWVFFATLKKPKSIQNSYYCAWPIYFLVRFS